MLIVKAWKVGGYLAKLMYENLFEDNERVLVEELIPGWWGTSSALTGQDS